MNDEPVSDLFVRAALNFAGALKARMLQERQEFENIVDKPSSDAGVSMPKAYDEILGRYFDGVPISRSEWQNLLQQTKNSASAKFDILESCLSGNKAVWGYEFFSEWPARTLERGIALNAVLTKAGWTYPMQWIKPEVWGIGPSGPAPRVPVDNVLAVNATPPKPSFLLIGFLTTHSAFRKAIEQVVRDQLGEPTRGMVVNLTKAKLAF